jgi:hypothetical protein
MIQSSFFRRCILAAVMLPIAASVAVAVSPKPASADEGCFCRPSECSDFDATCYILVCSDGTSKTCDGKWIET